MFNRKQIVAMEKCNSNIFICNSNILLCLQGVIVIERKQSNSNILQCNVIDSCVVLPILIICTSNDLAIFPLMLTM